MKFIPNFFAGFGWSGDFGTTVVFVVISIKGSLNKKNVGSLVDVGRLASEPH